MTLEKQEFSRQYSMLMAEYAESFDEAPLLAIEKLGQEMVQSNIPPEDLGEMHDAAIGELMASHELSADRIHAASLPLMQLLMAYGIAFRENRARHEIEQELAESNTQYRMLFESSRDAIVICDETGFLDGNQAAVNMFGCSSLDDFKGKHPSDVSPPTQPCGTDSTTLANSRVAMTFQDGSAQFEWVHQRMDGELFPAEVFLSVVNLDGQRVIQGTVRDITKRKQAENALHALSTTFSAVSGEAFFSNVVTHLATTLGMDYAIIGELIGAGDRINVVGGYAKGQAMELPFQYDLAGSPCENVVGQSFYICTSGVQQQYPENAQLAELGVEGYMGSPLFDNTDRPLGVMVLMHGNEIKNYEVAEDLFKVFAGRVSVEIERKRSDELVRKLSSAIGQAGESILISDRDGVIEYVNPAFTRITGYSSEDAIGQTPRLLNSGNQDAAFYEAMWSTITSGKVWHGKVIDRRKDGSFYPAMLTISPIFDESGMAMHYTHFIGIQSDLSALEDMEQRFHQAQKMEAIGIMVGGIAHNFKQFGYIRELAYR